MILSEYWNVRSNLWACTLIDDEESEGDTDKVDGIVNSIRLNANRVGQSAITSQGTSSAGITSHQCLYFCVIIYVRYLSTS